MKKEELITRLEAQKPQNIKICDKITKADLIKGILEAADAPTLIDLEREREDTGVSTLGENDPQSKESPEPETPDAQKGDDLSFNTNLGLLSVLLDDNFKDMSESSAAVIQKSMFNVDEIKLIQHTNLDDWDGAQPKEEIIFCRESDISGDKDKKSRCTRRSRMKEQLERGKRITYVPIPSGYLGRMYVRRDEDLGDKGVMTIIPPKGEKTEGPRLIAMGKAPITKESQIWGKQVSNTKYAVIFQPKKDGGKFLFPLTKNQFNFLYEQA